MIWKYYDDDDNQPLQKTAFFTLVKKGLHQDQSNQSFAQLTLGLVGFTQALTNTLMGLDGGKRKKQLYANTRKCPFLSCKLFGASPITDFAYLEIKVHKALHLKLQKNTNVPICFSWLNCALQGIEAMFWVSMRPFEACVTDVWQTDSLTNFNKSQRYTVLL